MIPKRVVTCIVAISSLFHATVFSKDAPAEETDESTVLMPEFRTSPTFHCNFGFGIAVFGDTAAGTIAHVFIDGVVEGSVADKMGLKTGDEIRSINGKKISEMTGGTKASGELFGLIVDRPAGEQINVEVLIRTTKKLDLTAGIR